MRYYQLKPSVPSALSAVPSPRPRTGSRSTLPDSRASVTYPDTRTQRLSAPEIRELGIASSVAWEKHVEACARDGWPVQQQARENRTTLKAVQDEWRHGQVKVATAGRAAGLRQLMRSDFRTVRAHFLLCAGMDEAAFAQLLRTGGTPHGEAAETVEQSARAVLGIVRKVEAHFATQGPDAGVRAAAWFQKIVQWKERKAGCGWKSWPAKAQWELYWTLKNRLADLLGTGNPANRNKSQRAARKTERSESFGHEAPDAHLFPAQKPKRHNSDGEPELF